MVSKFAILLTGLSLSALSFGVTHARSIPSSPRRFQIYLPHVRDQMHALLGSADLNQRALGLSMARQLGARSGLSPRQATLLKTPTLGLVNLKPAGNSEEELFEIQAAKMARTNDLMKEIGVRDGNLNTLILFNEAANLQALADAGVPLNAQQQAQMRNFGKTLGEMFGRRFDLGGGMKGNDGPLSDKMRNLWEMGQELVLSGRQPRNAFEAELINAVRQGMPNRARFWNAVDQALTTGNAAALDNWSIDLPSFLQSMQLTEQKGGPSARFPRLQNQFFESRAKLNRLFGTQSLSDINLADPFGQMGRNLGSNPTPSDNSGNTDLDVETTR